MHSRERYQDNSNVWKGGKWKCVDSHLLDEEIHFPDNRLCLDATEEMGETWTLCVDDGRSRMGFIPERNIIT